MIDLATGETIVLGTVKESVRAQLLPPNELLWSDAFDGIKADVHLIWKHNLFHHNVVLREQPQLPEGWQGESVRLEVVTEFFVDAEPELRKNDATVQGQELEDHVVIRLGALDLVVGKAMAIAEDDAFALSSGIADGGIPVLKQWHATEDGRRFLVESIAFQEAAEQMKDLPVAQSAANVPEQSGSTALARTWPPTPAALEHREAIELATAEYRPSGDLIDFAALPSGDPSVFAYGLSYYIQTSYYTGDAVVFESDIVIKYKENAYMLLYGPVTFPSIGNNPVFTSRNDDTFGTIAKGIDGETDSDGDPSTHRAAKAIWIYYSDYDVTIQNARILWAKIGVQRDRNSGQASSLTISNSVFQHITGTGTAGFAGDSTYLYVSDLRKCDVSNPGVTMANDCIGIENEFPGTSRWEFRSLSTPATPGWPGYVTEPEIEGFASLTSVNAGDNISFYVDVRSSDPTYRIEVYRMGWYNGLGARKMRWYDSADPASAGSVTFKALSSILQPTPAVQSDGLIDCLAGSTPWHSPYTFTVPKNWLSGVYLAKLMTETALKASYIIFVVRNDNRSSDLYFQSSVTTFQAYNPWGGRSLYNWPASRAARVSFNRPYAGPTDADTDPLRYGTGAGEFLVMINHAPGPAWEYNALRWIESHGFDVTYCTNIDTDQGWPAGKTTKAFLSVGHDEYWSINMRANVEARRDASVNRNNLVFLGANACFYKIDFANNFREFASDKTGSPANDLWRGTVLNDHESALIGIEFMYNTVPADTSKDTPMKIPADSTHWTLTYSAAYNASQPTVLDGLLGYEVDGMWSGTPPSCAFSHYPTQRSDVTILGESEFTPSCLESPTGYSLMTIYTAQSGAKVFATGSMQWNWGLDDYGYSTTSRWGPSRTSGVARQVTHNVLRDFTGQSLVPLP